MPRSPLCLILCIAYALAVCVCLPLLLHSSFSPSLSPSLTFILVTVSKMFFFSLPPYLYFSCSLSTSSSSCCSSRLSCCCHCWYPASLRCTVPCVCGGGIKRIWDGRVEVRSRGKVKDKRIVEVKGKKGRWGWGVWHFSLHSGAIQLYLAEGMETFLSRATASLEADFFSGVKAGETEILTTSGTCQMSGNISCLWTQQRVRSLPFSGKSNTFQSWNGYSWIQRHIHKCLLFVKMPSEVRGLRGYICSWCAEGVLAVSAAEGWDDHIHNCILI